MSVKSATAKSQITRAPSFLQAVSAVVRKDLASEFRSRELLSAMFLFALLVILIFNFALELNARERSEITAGVLWVTFVFAGQLGLNRSMAIEKDRNCLDGLLLAPVDRSAIYFGKMLANLLFMLIVEIIVLPIYSILYNVNLFQPGLILVIILGSLGYVTIGTLLATMAVYARTRDILLPILLFPVVVPLLIAAVRASSAFLQNLSMDFIWPSLNLLIVFNLIFIAVSYMTFDFIVEE